ncbi:MAG: phosphoribosylaminoimidazolesuccinocarboxamide synthase, partial [Planctomycetota bacterium]|nr:phosphoribosylaminoimidazolesuccinocarboxamide synthase [Planctomycetota bacterium]
MYQLPTTGSPPRVLMVATDRISAFDVIMPTPIPGKGKVLTAISVGWFLWLRTQHIVADHFLSLEVPPIDGMVESTHQSLEGRVMVCRSAQVIPIECVARGYLAGSGWSEYQSSGTAGGHPLPAGLRRGDKLATPLFTPASKAETGHDENISFETMCSLIGAPLAERLRSITLRLYEAAAAFAFDRGVILADTKFEFGFAIDASG